MQRVSKRKGRTNTCFNLFRILLPMRSDPDSLDSFSEFKILAILLGRMNGINSSSASNGLCNSSRFDVFHFDLKNAAKPFALLFASNAQILSSFFIGGKAEDLLDFPRS